MTGRSEPGARQQDGVLRLLDIRAEALSVAEVLAAVGDPAAGGTAVFVGTVREQDGGREVSTLGYSAHPSARQVLTELAADVALAHGVTALAAVHRVGDLVVGDLAVVVAVATPHRGEAFEACRELIDRLKAEVPIWKHQVFGDGGQEWVGSP